MENRNPLKAVGWLLVLVLLPAAGLVLYFFFGRDSRRKRLLSKHAYDRIIKNAAPDLPVRCLSARPDVGDHLPISRLITRMTGVPVMEAEEIIPFFKGPKKFDALREDILSARKNIHLQYYIWMDDRLGKEIADLLIRKAQEGVHVRVIYDDVGSWRASSSYFRKLRQNGVEVYPFLPVAFPILTSKINYRNHRKIVIIDGRIGYIGGMNIADRYVYGDRSGEWRDTHIRLTGNAVNLLQSSFVADWYVASQRILPKSVYFDPSLGDSSAPFSSLKIPLQIFQSGATGSWRILMQTLCLAIYNAKSSLWIQTPYFMPNDPVNKAITGAALRGLDVRLTLPLHSDTFGVKYASSSYIQELLRAGVRVHFYRTGFLHAKVLTIDGTMTMMGSANMDFRSLEHNFEISCCIYDKTFTQLINHAMEKDFDHSTIMTLREWDERPFLRRLWESTMRLFSPLL